MTTYRSLINAASLKRAGVMTAAVMPFRTKHDAWTLLESPLT